MLQSGSGYSAYDVYTKYNNCRESAYWDAYMRCLPVCADSNYAYRRDACTDV